MRGRVEGKNRFFIAKLSRREALNQIKGEDLIIKDEEDTVEEEVQVCLKVCVFIVIKQGTNILDVLNGMSQIWAKMGELI